MSNTVLGTFDAGGDGIDVIIHLLSQLDGRQYHRDDFVFTNPAINTDPSFQKNSVIRMQPKAASGYYASRKVFYNRINIADIGPLTILEQDVTTETTLVELLPLINDKYGIFIQASDIVDAEIPPADMDGNISIDLEFTESSIIFYGGTTIEIPEYDCPECPDTPGGAWTPGIVFLGLDIEKIGLGSSLDTPSMVPAVSAMFSSDLLEGKVIDVSLGNYSATVNNYIQTEHRTLQTSSGIEAVYVNRQEKNRVMAAWGEFNAGELDVETLDDPLEGVYFMDEFGNVLHNGNRVNNRFGTSSEEMPNNKHSDRGDPASEYYTTVMATDPGEEDITYTPHWRVLCVKHGGDGYVHALVVPNYNDNWFKIPLYDRTMLTLCGHTFPAVMRNSTYGYRPQYAAYYVFSTDNGRTWNTGLETNNAIFPAESYNPSLTKPIYFLLDGIYKYQMGSNQMYATGPKVCISVLNKLGTPADPGVSSDDMDVYQNYEAHVNTAGRVAELHFIEISGAEKLTLDYDSIKVQEEPRSSSTHTSSARGVLGIWLCDRTAADIDIPEILEYTPGFIAPQTDIESLVADEINGFMLVNEMGTITMHHFHTNFDRIPYIPSYAGDPELDEPIDMWSYLTIRPCKNGYDPYLFSQYGAHENIDHTMLKVLNAIQPVSTLVKVAVDEDTETGDRIRIQHIHAITTPSKLSHDLDVCLFTTDTAQVVQESELWLPNDSNYPPGWQIRDRGFSPVFGSHSATGLMEPTGPVYGSEDFSAIHITHRNVKTVLFKGLRKHTSSDYGVYGMGFDSEVSEATGLIRPDWVRLMHVPQGDGVNYLKPNSRAMTEYAVGQIDHIPDVNDVTLGFASLLSNSGNGAPFHTVDKQSGPGSMRAMGFDGTTAFLHDSSGELLQTLYGALNDLEYLAYTNYDPESGLPQPDPVEPKGLYPFPFKFNNLWDYDLRLQPALSGITHAWQNGNTTRWYDYQQISWPSFLMKNSNYVSSFRVGMIGEQLDLYRLMSPEAWGYAFEAMVLPSITVNDRTDGAAEIAVSVANAVNTLQPILEDRPFTHTSPKTSPNFRIMLDNAVVLKNGSLLKKTLYSSQEGNYKPITYTQVTGTLRNSEKDTMVMIDNVIPSSAGDTYLNTSFKEQLFSKGLSNRGARLDYFKLAEYDGKPTYTGYLGEVSKKYTYAPVFPRYGNDVTNSTMGFLDYIDGIPGETIGEVHLVGTAVGYSGVDPKLRSTTGFLNMTSDIVELSENLPYREYITPKITYSLVARHHRTDAYVPGVTPPTPIVPTKTQVMVLTYDGNYWGADAEQTEFGYTERTDFEFPVKQSVEIKLDPPFEGMAIDYTRIFATTRIAQTETSAVNPAEILLTVSDGHYFKVFKTKCFERRDLDNATSDELNIEDTQAYGFGEQTSYYATSNVTYASDLGGTHYRGRLMPVRVDNVHAIPYVYTTVDVGATPTKVMAHSDATAIFYDLHVNCFVIARLYPNPNYDDIIVNIEKVANGFTEQVTAGESDIYLSLAYVDVFPGAMP